MKVVSLTVIEIVGGYEIVGDAEEDGNVFDLPKAYASTKNQVPNRLATLWKLVPAQTTDVPPKAEKSESRS